MVPAYRGGLLILYKQLYKQFNQVNLSCVKINIRISLQFNQINYLKLE